MNQDKRTWQDYYSSKEALDGYQFHFVDMIRQVMPVTGSWFLEIGCGQAGDSWQLAFLGARSVAVDISFQALELGRVGHHGNRVCFAAADAFNLPFASGSFDLIFHQGFLEHFPNPGPILVEQHRLLRPGGLLVVDVPQRWHFYTVLKHALMALGQWRTGWETEYTVEQLERLVTQYGFTHVASYGWGGLVTWGLQRQGYLPRDFPAGWPVLERLSRGFRRSRWQQHFALNVGVVARKMEDY